MTGQLQRLRDFIGSFSQIGLWQRLFGWKRVRRQSYEAVAELTQLSEAVVRLSAEQQHQKEKLITAESTVTHLTAENQTMRAEIKPLQQRLSELHGETVRLREAEEQRVREYERKIQQANQLWQQLDGDRKRIEAERQSELQSRFDEIRKTWSVHEDFVKQRIREICTRQGVEFVEDHALEKKPDCVIRINDEFVIFDAKSPSDPSRPESFPGYVKNQTSELEKYANQEGVRKELFLVVPGDVIDRVPQLIYQIAGYTVHVISPDALEPIIFGLKRLETYENLNDLTPEEREVICGVIGKFVHLTKRRVQIDQHWAFEILSLLSKARSLPSDFTDMIAKYEKNGLYNVEPDRRGKAVADDRVKERKDEIDRMIEPALKTITASLFGD